MIGLDAEVDELSVNDDGDKDVEDTAIPSSAVVYDTHGLSIPSSTDVEGAITVPTNLVAAGENGLHATGYEEDIQSFDDDGELLPAFLS